MSDPSLPVTHESFGKFFLTCPAVKENDGEALVGACHLARVQPGTTTDAQHMYVWSQHRQSLGSTIKPAEMQRINFFSFPCSLGGSPKQHQRHISREAGTVEVGPC